MNPAVAVQTSEDITSLVKKLQYNLASTTARALSNRSVLRRYINDAGTHHATPEPCLLARADSWNE
jgi:hypothetical protein